MVSSTLTRRRMAAPRRPRGAAPAAGGAVLALLVALAAGCAASSPRRCGRVSLADSAAVAVDGPARPCGAGGAVCAGAGSVVGLVFARAASRVEIELGAGALATAFADAARSRPVAVASASVDGTVALEAARVRAVEVVGAVPLRVGAVGLCETAGDGGAPALRAKMSGGETAATGIGAAVIGVIVVGAAVAYYRRRCRRARSGPKRAVQSREMNDRSVLQH